MQSFVIRPMTWPVLRLFSRNPLMRLSDRVETAVVTLSVLFVFLAAAGAGVMGTVIHDGQAQRYREQAQTRHTVAASAVDDSRPTMSAETTPFTVHARWKANGVDHIALIGWNKTVKTGDALEIWVDDHGRVVAAPRPVGRAALDAVALAFIGWMIAILAAAEVVGAVRAHLRRIRDSQWDKDICSLADGGFTNRQQ
jgi:hypothetical protein